MNRRTALFSLATIIGTAPKLVRDASNIVTTNLEHLLASTQNTNKMYAKEVVDYEGVVNPKNALSKPDKEYAEILPYGELILKMKQPFSPLMFYNDGYIIAKPGVNYSLAALIPTEDTHALREIIPNSSGGFKIPKDDLTIVDTIIIKNIDTKSLYIDGVVGYTNFNN